MVPHGCSAVAPLRVGSFRISEVRFEYASWFSLASCSAPNRKYTFPGGLATLEISVSLQASSRAYAGPIKTSSSLAKYISKTAFMIGGQLLTCSYVVRFKNLRTTNPRDLNRLHGAPSSCP